MKIENTVLIKTVTSFWSRDQNRGKMSLKYFTANPTSASVREKVKSIQVEARIRWGVL